MRNTLKTIIKEHLAFIIFSGLTMILMCSSIIWVYHIKVLNAPKVYSDGFGYYVYLPAVLYHDFQFSFVEGWEHSLDLIQTTDGIVNKYPVGTAIMESPFFFMAHFLSLARDAFTGSNLATGYTNLYQYFVLIGGIFYWTAGTIFLYRLLIRYIGISRKISCITCIMITYGTNLFHYASYDACFSHVYSYAVLTFFLYYLCWYEEREKESKNRIGHTCVFGVLAGLIFMLRNTNLLFVLTYILYGVRDWSSLKTRLITVLKPQRAVPIIFAGFITIMPQLCYWHAVTGHWFLYSYGADESFFWLSPEIINFLFSVRKGMLFWNPILIVSFAGIVYEHKNAGKLYWGLVIFLVSIIYLSSAWWSWYYGGSYGQRVTVDFMCVFAIFMARLLNGMSAAGKKAVGKIKVLKVLVYSYMICCAGWNCICMLGYWYRIIPSDGAEWRHLHALIEWVL